MSFPDDESHNEVGEYKVICGRSSRFSNHIGNHYFHGLINNSLQTYSDASRWGKTVLISAIVDQVRQKPDGGFVRRDPLCGTKSRYVEVDDYHAVCIY